ncbi:glycoside hydrolase family 13 protein [Gymnopus androsaceus JB14]|uniref:Alpha-amylase n=1 Tax=Gymnopus androsaceus JB14 TaxID=1447944 RepID=A0A6A4GR81_9AGAR|nr:glycoside hydrolase family 13 protein [Gymnopus androsaceus JB14]
MKYSLTTGAAAVALLGFAPSSPTDFALGNGSSPSCDTSSRVYCGGNWEGVVSKLDYIQDMGFDAIWISPIVQNVEGSTTEGEAYHGYWPQNINSLNSNFGSADDLKNLSTSLHDRGMYLMVDVVVNHVVANPTNTTNVSPETFDYSLLQPFGSQSSFHTQCFISDYNNQTNVEQCWLGDYGLPLLDLDTENSTTVDTMYTWIKDLVQSYGVDGLRIDTAKHIRQDFWPGFVSSAGVYSVGEILIGNVTYAAPYTDVLDSVLDYPTYYAVYDAFTNGTSGNMSAIAEMVTQAQDQYNHSLFYAGSFIENQDNPRIQSTVTDQAVSLEIRSCLDWSSKIAMTWPFINDGIPILYYGQEQGYAGGNDPNNLSGSPASTPITNPSSPHVTTLNTARKQAIASNSSFLTTSLKFISQSDSSALAVSKPPMLTLLTNAGNSSYGMYSGGETVVDVLTCNTYTAGSDGSLSVKTSGGEPMVLMPATALSEKGTLCASVAKGTGSDGQGSSSKSGAERLEVGRMVVLGRFWEG